MPKRIAIIDYGKCRPQSCSVDRCQALLACPRPDEILVQEVPGDYPYVMQDLCRGCGDCARACPLEAVHMTN